jgi:hypothetical protein
MVYRPRYPWHYDALSMVYRLPTHRILTHLYPWYIGPLPMIYRPSIHGILPPNHGISTPLPMLYQPATHGILTTLPMAF